MTTQRVVPDGKDCLDGLTLRELDIASRKLETDVVDAFKTGAGGKRYAAMATVAWLWAKRADPQAKRDTYLELDTTGILTALGLDDDADDGGDDLDVDVNPTDSARE